MSISSYSLIKGATTLVAALAWNEAAKNTVEAVVPMTKNGEPKDKNAATRAKASIAYAVIVTLLIIFLIYVHNRAKENIARINSPGFITNSGGAFDKKELMKGSIARFK